MLIIGSRGGTAYGIFNLWLKAGISASLIDKGSSSKIFKKNFSSTK